mmetsp:Transcript_14202/g.40524  ORF Transcript_14202/g.40524 Transcript_14202/m.40524 type:complete len:394 (+) Transcript_14202:68-1249(+)
MPRPTNGLEAMALVAGIKPQPRRDDANFYEVLDVPQSASPHDIRQAYLRLSLKYHPDKNPGDEVAKRRFQQISEAYQVLSDPKLRAKYDATGSVDGIDFEDAAAVFTQLFGSPKFDVYIGRLRLASMILFEGDDEAFVAYEKQRLEDLILNLSIIVQQYTLSNDLDSFIFAMGEEAKVLAKEQHGARLLHLLGSVYVREAQIVLANVLRSSVLRLQAVGRGIGQNFKSAAALVKTMLAAKEGARKLQESANAQTRASLAIDPGDPANSGESSVGVSGAKSEEQLRIEAEREKADAERVLMEVAEKALPLVYDTVWTLNTQEITTLTAKVVRGVLSNIGKEERKKRAVAIYELGRIFRSQSYKDERPKTEGPDAATLMADIERAMLNVMQSNET